MHTKGSVILISAALALGACGSGGGGTSASGTVSSTEAAREFTSDLSQAQRLLDINSALAPTAPDTLPGGRAEFDGKVAMVFGNALATFEAADLLGDVDLEADFRTGTIRGWLDDFNTRGGESVRGDIYLRNGQITGSDFAADIDGRLTGPAAAPGNVSGAIEGTFLGAGASGAAGTGAASTDGGAATLIFEAARDFD
jgi:hypothetical protein